MTQTTTATARTFQVSICHGANRTRVEYVIHSTNPEAAESEAMFRARGLKRPSVLVTVEK